MQLLLEYEWLAINELLFNIFKAKNDIEMRTVYLQNIRLLIPYSKASFYLADFSGQKVLTDGLGINFDEGVLPRYPNEYIEYDYGKWIFMSSESKVYRTSDWFPENMRESEPYYENAFKPNNIHFEVRLPLYYNSLLVGFTALFRASCQSDFSDRDLFILDQVKNFLAYYLYKHVFLRQEDIDESSVIEPLAARYNLTLREKEILFLIISSKSNEEIANKLCITLSTQKKHVMNIYKKLNIRSRNELFKLLNNSFTK